MCTHQTIDMLHEYTYDTIFVYTCIHSVYVYLYIYIYMWSVIKYTATLGCLFFFQQPYCRASISVAKMAKIPTGRYPAMALQVDGRWGLVKPHYRVGIDRGFSNWGMACSPAFFFSNLTKPLRKHPKTSMTIEQQPFEDVSPIKDGDVPLSC